mmetsp:Transcript_12418/g.25651  ORF Transcript_12418/g.25651 Transcript_12418/m.25651 type:complete len:262 (-) Transcript_12418:175-960(-)
MMEPVEICESSNGCDEDRGDASDMLRESPYIDVELGSSLPTVPLQVPDWLKIDQSGSDGGNDWLEIDQTDSEGSDSQLMSSSISCRGERNSVSQSNQRQSPSKRKAVSFRETTDVYLIPLPTPEEKRARFYSLDQIAAFRLEAERAVMKQYIEDMMQRPCTSLFSHDDGNDQQGSPTKPEQDRPLHHSEAVEGNLSQLMQQGNERTNEDSTEGDEVEALLANGPPYFFVNTARRYVKQAAKQNALQLVTGLCIVAYVYNSV